MRISSKNLKIIVAAMLILLIGALVFNGNLKAYAQDGHHGQGHTENHDWYEKLRQPDNPNQSCCYGTKNGVEGDCRPTRAYPNNDGSWTALINGREVTVPSSKVVRNQDGTVWNAPDGRNHICAGKSGVVYCLIGAPPKS